MRHRCQRNVLLLLTRKDSLTVSLFGRWRGVNDPLEPNRHGIPNFILSETKPKASKSEKSALCPTSLKNKPISEPTNAVSLYLLHSSASNAFCEVIYRNRNNAWKRINRKWCNSTEVQALSVFYEKPGHHGVLVAHFKNFICCAILLTKKDILKENDFVLLTMSEDELLLNRLRDIYQ